MRLGEIGSFPSKIVSGGQTGVDRAALDAAACVGLGRGGWCPRGRRAEDGEIPPRYPLREAPVGDYAVRTRLNVRDSDATLVLVAGPPDPGTSLTMDLARRLGRPWRRIDLRRPAAPAVVAEWLRGHRVRTLNVAGPRESRSPGIGAAAEPYLVRVLRAAANRQ
ncbi:MAG: molybdenum cofactor carrier [Alphaproteobacteria bacterium]|nr:molybdenum cofactor carrier [Alphaproteobacteria bacterium]